MIKQVSPRFAVDTVVEMPSPTVYESGDLTLNVPGGTFMKHIPGTKYFNDPLHLRTLDDRACVLSPINGTYEFVGHWDIYDELMVNIDRFFGDEILGTHFAAFTKNDKEMGKVVGSKVIGMISLGITTGEAEEKMNLAVGFTNSVDGSSRLIMGAGTNMFICDNTAFSGDLVFGHRHTKNILDQFRAQAVGLVSKAEQVLVSEVRRKNVFGQRPITLQDGTDFLIKLYKKGYLNATGGPKKSMFGRVMAEWDEPSFETFTERNVWSLYNAATYGVTRAAGITAMANSNKISRAFDERFM